MKKIIINDTGLAFPTLAQSDEITLLDEKELVQALHEKFLAKSFEPENTIFIYPGESARRIKTLGFSQEFESFFVPAKRIWVPGTDPIVTVGGVATKNFLLLRIKDVVVVDDVLSSGATLSLLWERNAWLFPRATWHAYVPVTRKVKLVNYASITYGVFVPPDEKGRKPPINSLSTFLENQEILENYLSRNFNSKLQDQIRYALTY